VTHVRAAGPASGVPAAPYPQRGARTEIVGPNGNEARLLDEVDVIAGMSGGSLAALAKGLCGD
jgi:hypothetical protein